MSLFLEFYSQISYNEKGIQNWDRNKKRKHGSVRFKFLCWVDAENVVECICSIFKIFCTYQQHEMLEN